MDVFEVFFGEPLFKVAFLDEVCCRSVELVEYVYEVSVVVHSSPVLEVFVEWEESQRQKVYCVNWQIQRGGEQVSEKRKYWFWQFEEEVFLGEFKQGPVPEVSFVAVNPDDYFSAGFCELLYVIEA